MGVGPHRAPKGGRRPPHRREEHVDDEQFIAELSESRRDGRWTFRELLLDIASNERFAIAREDMHDPEGEAP